MAITHEASTGVEAAASAKGTVSTTAAYAGVAAGRLGVLAVTLKPDTASFGALAGWTPILDVVGGQPGEAVSADTGPTRLGVWVRELDGTETGNITITATGSPDCLVGGLSVYSRTAAAWAAPIYVNGTDDVHGGGFAATAGSWSSTLATGDVVVIARTSDSDAIGAKASFVLTQTGASFDTINYRNNRLNSSAGDCCVATWDAAVLTGSDQAPTFTHTMTASSCGALAVIRLREASAGSATGNLAATLPALTAAATGALEVAGTATATLPALTAAAAGQVTATGAIVATLPALTGDLAGSALATGPLEVTLPILMAELVGELVVSGIADATLPALTAAFAGPTGSVVIRPNTGTVTRPDTGTVTRPYIGVVIRP